MATVKLIDFWAPWCVPCKVMDPVLDEIRVELGDQLEFEEVNVDEEIDRARNNGVRGIPTYVVIKNGEEVGRRVGVTPKAELLKLIQE